MIITGALRVDTSEDRFFLPHGRNEYSMDLSGKFVPDHTSFFSFFNISCTEYLLWEEW